MWKIKIGERRMPLAPVDMTSSVGQYCILYNISIARTAANGEFGEWPVMAGKRPDMLMHVLTGQVLHLSLLGYFERVVDLDSKIAYGAF